MFLLGLILILVLQFEGISGQRTRLYYRPGQDAILSCSSKNSPTTCSEVSWLYNRDNSETSNDVVKGKSVKTSPRAARLSLQTNCSLVIKKVTAEDVGFFTCRQWDVDTYDVATYLSVLTISPNPPDADPERDGEVTLECSLLRDNNLGPCNENSLRWLNGTGTVLLGEGVGYKFLGQTNCVSRLKVKRQSGHNRRYTCKFVYQSNVLIQGDYTPVFTAMESKPDEPNGLDQTYIIIIGAAVGLVVVLVIVAAVLLRRRNRTKVTHDVQMDCQNDEPENNLTYVSVSHANHQVPPKKKIKEEEEVTYSTVKTPVAEADSDPSCLYSSVSKPK